MEEEITSSDTESNLTDWSNPPSVSDLKQDLLEAQSSHDSQVSKINTWLDNLNVIGSAKIGD